jgi:hypothetical protein
MTHENSTESPQTLAHDLARLEKTHQAGQHLTIAELVELLGDRGHAVAILILGAPFLVIPIPGLSTAIGGVIILMAIALMLNRKPWLPTRLRNRQISPAGLQRLVHGTNRVLRRLERHVKPRMLWVTGQRWHWLIGFSLLAGAVALALPLPIPGNNIPPAVGIVLLALGLLERDGLLVLIGHIYTALLWLGIIVLAIMFWDAIGGWVISKWQSVFG